MKTILKLILVIITITFSSCENKNTIDFYSFPANGNPLQIKISDNSLVVSNWRKANISRFETNNYQLLNSTKLDSTLNKNINEYFYCPPNDIVVGKENLFVSQAFCQDILILGKENLEIEKRISNLGGGKLALSKEEDFLAIGNGHENKLYLVDLNSYQVDSFNFPLSGRGIGSILIKNDEIILGIQRGKKGSKQGNCFAAYFDLKNQAFTDSTYLAEIDPTTKKADDSIPHFILDDKENDKIYVGLFQSKAGIKTINPKTKNVKSKISFEPNGENSHFKWVDPLALGIYKDWLISLNRHNKEIVFIDRNTEKKVCQVHFDEFSGSTNSFVINDHIAYITDKQNDKIYIVPLSQIEDKIENRKDKNEIILLSGRLKNLKQFNKNNDGA